MTFSILKTELLVPIVDDLVLTNKSQKIGDMSRKILCAKVLQTALLRLDLIKTGKI